MAFLIGGANSAAADAGYDVDNSLRFNDDDGAYLQRTAGANTGEDNATLSFWFKLGNIKSDNNGGHIMTEGGTTGYTIMQIYAQKIYIGSSTFGIMFPNLIRDPSAWYHLFVAFDSSQATDTNRVKAYLNGVLLTDVVTFTDYPDQNENLDLCVDGNTTRVGSRGNSGAEAFDGYLAEFHFLDGTTKAYTDFGEFDEDSGIWKPKEYTDGSYGNNGFFLEFKQSGTGTNSSGMGADTSGNNNHFAVTSLAATDQCTDTPTNNFATWNPLGTLGGGVANAGLTLAEGNTLFTPTTDDYSKTTTSTFAITSGKWYAEFLCETAAGGNPLFGLMSVEKISTMQNTNNWQGTRKAYISLIQGTDGYHKAFGSEDAPAAYGNAIGGGEIMMLAIDMDNGKIYFGEEGTWYNSGDPANETNPASSFAVATYPENVIFGQTVLQASGGYVSANFGNPSFSISSGNADANGYGNFEFAPPSGFYALCTKNLAEYG